MKNILPVILLVLLSVSGYAQDRDTLRRVEREARREQRRAARAIRDSLSLVEFDNDSVNIGYGYIKRKNLTTSVSRVKVNRDEVVNYVDIGEYLQGRVPGLSVRKVGGSYKYIIRGINSINASTDPLFVVDGATVTDISFLDPRDVKSVEVLKDASASIYGTRGACGVILITTYRHN